ncbi:MAG: hypothetical protein K2X90_02655 [Candidatus Babeliaceae bacterium]|nr:hypothetical protein [Candidatus Babeliaceae bacterium]
MKKIIFKMLAIFLIGSLKLSLWCFEADLEKILQIHDGDSYSEYDKQVATTDFLNYLPTFQDIELYKISQDSNPITRLRITNRRISQILGKLDLEMSRYTNEEQEQRLCAEILILKIDQRYQKQYLT